MCQEIRWNPDDGCRTQFFQTRLMENAYADPGFAPKKELARSEVLICSLTFPVRLTTNYSKQTDGERESLPVIRY